jgi:glycosyltransferase involved in cell wall biosynthesis
LKHEGFAVDTIFCKDIPGMDVRFYQAQADIVVDMLTFGWFGANIREGMMLGKPCVCFLRPEWLQSMRNEIPAYVDELPVINATPYTIYQVLVDLIMNPDKRYMVGKKGREFAMKWHSSEAGAKRFQKIYTDLLARSSLTDIKLMEN